MTSIDRTAYPRFRRSVPTKELQESFTPSEPEIAWARERVRTPEHLLALLLLLKAFQRLGCFPDLFEIPLPVADHIRGVLGLASSVVAEHASSRTGERQRAWVRERLGVVFDPPTAEQLARRVISEAALSKDNPADLINVALEQLVAQRFELPGYSTLDELATTVRREVNDGIYAAVQARISESDRMVLTGLLRVDPVTRRSLFDELKRTAAAATVSRFREHLAHLTWLDGLGVTDEWVAAVPPAKVSHFAAVARVSNAGDIREMTGIKQIVLIASLLHIARIRGRDDLATMYCKRMASIHKQARDRFERLRESARAETEHLVDVFGDVLAAVRESMSPSSGELDTRQVDPVEQVWQRTGQAVLSTLIGGGGVEALSTSHEQVSAFHGDNCLPFLEQHYRTSRATLFDMLDVLDLVATTADRKVLDAVEFLRAGRRRSSEHIPDHADGHRVDLSFRRHFEVCVFSYLAAELRVGDIAVTGSESYANLQDQLLSWEDCQPLIAGYCAEIGLPPEASAFRQVMEEQLTAAAAAVDVGYPENADLVIDDAGQPILKRRRGNARRPSALALEQKMLARLPERSLLDVVARVAHWTGWPRHFGPVSGSDPKIRDALGRYVLLTFAYGANLGPYQMSRHMGGLVSPHQLSTALAHAGPARIDAARTDVVNAYAALDLPRLWGDGSHAAADGSQIDTWADNLLAETHIRYGGVGGLAYRHIADNYIALFTHFIPCGVWEAIYIIEGLLRNESDLQPTSIHADTQGQSLPVFGLAPLLGFELLPRIRNWKDLILYRPSKSVRYRHIDALFDPDKSINWSLIETHWPDLLRVVLSIRAGKISSVALLRRLGHDSRKNKLYRAFRELGRVTRTIVLLRYLSDPALRDSIAIITNRMESYNGFCQWLSFGSDVLADNDPEHQEKLVKFNELLANSLIFSTTLDITAVANTLASEGVAVHRDDLATISPYITSKTRRFGDWALDLTPPPALLGNLDLPEEPEPDEDTLQPAGAHPSAATSGN